ncbi:MAG: hypothetical protein ACOY32_15070 [Thermodesulfobacteriota bacterium]
MPVLIKANTYYDWEPLAAEIIRLLRESEYTQLPDSPLSAADIATVAAWRADLYDLLTSTADAHTITIPTCAVDWELAPAGAYGVVPPAYTAD